MQPSEQDLPGRASDSCAHLDAHDAALARELFTAGIKPRTIAHALQLPESAVGALVKGQPRLSKPLIAPRKLFNSPEHPARYATSADAANKAVCTGRVERWWAQEFGYRKERACGLDDLWALEDLPSQASHFIVCDGKSRCPQCKAALWRFKPYVSPPSEKADIVAQPVGTTVEGYAQPAGSTSIERTPTQIVWGVDEVVCAACWAAYEPSIPARMVDRRRRLRTTLISARNEAALAARPAPASELQLLCERHGVSSVDLWIPMADPSGLIDEMIYCLVEAVEGDVLHLRVRAPGRVRSRRYQSYTGALERALELKQTINSAEQPIYRTELQLFCERLGITAASLVISFNGRRTNAVVIWDGKVVFRSNSQPEVQCWTLSVEQVEELVRQGKFGAAPSIACTQMQSEGKLRYPCATDSDVLRIGVVLDCAMETSFRASRRKLMSASEWLSPMRVWELLARFGDDVGDPGWASAVRLNASALRDPSSSPAVHCAAGWLLHQLTTNRSSLIGRHVLQKIDENIRFEPMIEPLLADWKKADAVLAPYAAAGKRMGLVDALT